MTGPFYYAFYMQGCFSLGHFICHKVSAHIISITGWIMAVMLFLVHFGENCSEQFVNLTYKFNLLD